MKLVFALIKNNVKGYIQHKWAFLFTLFVQPIILVVNYYIFNSIYDYSGAKVIQGYEVEQMIWYYTAIHFVSIFIWNNAQGNISSKVLSGDISIDFLKPISLYKIELADAIGLRIVGIILEFFPAIIMYSFIVFPSFITCVSVIQFLLVAIVSFFIYFNIGYIIGMFSFLLKRSGTINAIKDVLVNVFGGVLIPLEFYPDNLEKVLNYLPFKYIFYWPTQFFLNKYSGEWNVFKEVIEIQLFWCVLLYACACVMSHVMTKKYCAVGG